MKKHKEVKEEVKEESLAEVKINKIQVGISLYIKSKYIEDKMIKLSDDKKLTGQERWGYGRLFYNVNPMEFNLTPSGMYAYISEYGKYELMDFFNSRYNFSFIQTVGVKDGIELIFVGTFSQKTIEKFKKDFQRFIVDFYEKTKGK